MVINKSDLSIDNFIEETSKQDTIVKFYADWCGPCKMMAPIFEEVSNEVENITFFEINIDDNKELAIELGVKSIPTLILFKNGEIKKNSGYIPKHNLLDFIK